MSVAPYPPTIPHTDADGPSVLSLEYRRDLCLGYDGMHVLGGLAKDTMCRTLHPDNPRNSRSVGCTNVRLTAVNGQPGSPSLACVSELLQGLLVTSYLAT